MIRLLDLMFYVGYLRIKKNENKYASSTLIAHITLIGMGVHGLLFFNGSFSLIGVVMDVPMADIFMGGNIFGVPNVFLSAIATMIAYYFYSVRNKRYLKYPQMYPEINEKNLDKYDQKYLVTPAVIGILVLFAGIFLPFILHRGV
ncbi:hypothetical protein [Catenovulum sediminis]|uniref:hypothetical protein n=1 Tax=Catenovulum sediminis TaxID=1740262 RepID=UPI0011805EEC|nr:hypothetical protein [Catenovulum sediminis]